MSDDDDLDPVHPPLSDEWEWLIVLALLAVGVGLVVLVAVVGWSVGKHLGG